MLFDIILLNSLKVLNLIKITKIKVCKLNVYNFEYINKSFKIKNKWF